MLDYHRDTFYILSFSFEACNVNEVTLPANSGSSCVALKLKEIFQTDRVGAQNLPQLIFRSKDILHLDAC